MGNVQAEKIFTFMTYNFNTFLLFTFLVSLLTLAACWLIKKYICPSRNNPSQPSDVVQFQLTSEERRRHLVVQAREQRWKKCQILLQDVSMIVTEGSFQYVNDDNDDIEMGNKMDENSDSIPESSMSNFTLILPHANNRNLPYVSGSCSICLTNYQIGDRVVWSTNPCCVHAYHENCILNWLSKVEEGLCPICRQDFCINTSEKENELDSEEDS